VSRDAPLLAERDQRDSGEGDDPRYPERIRQALEADDAREHSDEDRRRPEDERDRRRGGEPDRVDVAELVQPEEDGRAAEQHQRAAAMHAKRPLTEKRDRTEERRRRAVAY